MTYKELQRQIKRMSKEQKNCDITVQLSKHDEFFGVVDDLHCECNGVLDNWHPFLIIDA